MKSKSEWLDYIYQLNPKTIDLGLRRIQRCNIAQRLQLTQFDCPVITIAGTNGKGSVVALLEAMLLAAGKKVAAYISPHLLEFNERIRCNGQEISDRDLLASFKTIEQYREETPLTFFEFTTLCALYYFKQQQPDVILLEVGLGGRQDAVNIVDCDVAVISSIDFDHQDYLGDTLEKIAYEKVGIARAFKPVICGDLDPPASISKYCEEINAPLWLLHRDFTFEKKLNTWDWQGRTLQFTALPYAKLKIENVATALAVIEYLWPNLPKNAIDSGIQTAGFAGRFEKTADGIIFDVAHNPEATQWLAEQLQRDFPNKKITAIFSMLRDKDIAASILPLKNIIDEWCVIELDCPRAATIAEINTILASQSIKKWYNFSTANSALQHVKQSRDPNKDVIVVFGSFYTVAAVKGALEWTSS